MTQVVAVAAIGKNRELGKSGELVWRIPDDLKRFKALTLGHPVIMGRKTFDSIIRALGKPLPGRTSIVVTRDTSWAHEGVVVAHSIEDAIEKGKSLDGERVCVWAGQKYTSVRSRMPTCSSSHSLMPKTKTLMRFSHRMKINSPRCCPTNRASMRG